ncbi:PDR/VanB family oxidoreductase [Streptomyces sp. NPDC047841]|uniref:PDR/VanB family oxidoreductase n=1 Tax=Streptomyces sp. NPDC047841 TaxID=3154708 RepID=UPI00345190EE
MSRTLLVKQVRAEAPQVVTLTLVDPAGGPLPPWEPGAHVELVLPSGLVRQYSLCGDDLDRTSYTVAVRHETGGRGGSREIHTSALVGRELAVRGPRNHFPLARAARHFLVAGGIGVTPVLAMARALQRSGQDWQVLYCGHHGDMPFVDELNGLDADRVTVVRTDRDGRPDIASLIGRLPEGTTVYCCGPPSLLTDVTKAAAAAGAGLEVRVERFSSSSEAPPGPAEGDHTFEVELARSGAVITVPAERSVLDAVRDVRPDVPFSCEEGYCGSCETRVVDGTPDHRDEVLGANEHARGSTMMICVSRAVSPRLVLDL